MQTQAVLTTIKNNVATITLNRPTQLNALNLELCNALADALANVHHNKHVRAVIINGAGDHFMAGGDIHWFKSLLNEPGDNKQAKFEQVIQVVNNIVLRIQHMQKPVIASVKGAAAGFGFSLMAACDLVIASNNSYFTLAYCHIGTSPDGGATFTLPRIVGHKKAMEIALLGDRFDASKAKELGLVNQICTPEELEEQSNTLAQRLSAGPSIALANTKRLINLSMHNSLEQQLNAEMESFSTCTTTADFIEGITAFTEKRKPDFNSK